MYSGGFFFFGPFDVQPCLFVVFGCYQVERISCLPQWQFIGFQTGDTSSAGMPFTVSHCVNKRPFPFTPCDPRAAALKLFNKLAGFTRIESRLGFYVTFFFLVEANGMKVKSTCNNLWYCSFF